MKWRTDLTREYLIRLIDDYNNYVMSFSKYSNEGTTEYPVNVDEFYENEFQNTDACSCEVCGSQDAELVPHPYTLEMYGEESPSWLCSECQYQAMMDV